MFYIIYASRRGGKKTAVVATEHAGLAQSFLDELQIQHMGLTFKIGEGKIRPRRALLANSLTAFRQKDDGFSTVLAAA